MSEEKKKFYESQIEHLRESLMKVNVLNLQRKFTQLNDIKSFDTFLDLLSELKILNTLTIDYPNAKFTLDGKFPPPSQNNADIIVEFAGTTIYIDIFNLRIPQKSISTNKVSGVKIGDSSQWIEDFRMKILEKIESKTSGLDPELFQYPVLIAIGPQGEDWDNYQLNILKQALTSAVNWIPQKDLIYYDDPAQKPFQNFTKANLLLSGVILSKKIPNSPPNLGLWIIENKETKNKIPKVFTDIINTKSLNKKLFDINLIPAKATTFRI